MANVERISDILNRELTALKDEIIQRSKDTGAWASGETADGYAVAVESDSHGWLGGFGYVAALSTGRKPGSAPMYFSEIIKRWIIAKGLNFEDEKDLDRWSRAIAWKIRRDGSWLYRNNERRDIFDTAVNDFHARLSKQIAFQYQIQLTNSIF